MKKRIQTTSGSDLSEQYKRNIQLDGTYDYVKHTPKSGEFVVPGKHIDWISQGSDYVLYIPAYNLVATPLNNWNFDKLSYIAKMVQQSRAGTRPRPQFELPWGHASVITASDVGYAQYLDHYGRLETETTLSTPWTTRNDAVDKALAAEESTDFFEELESDYYFLDEADEAIIELSQGEVEPEEELTDKIAQLSALAESLNLGDIGEIEFTLRDGNHRAFGALAAGEPGVIVSASNTTDIETWPLLQQTIQPYLIDTNQYWKAKKK